MIPIRGAISVGSFMRSKDSRSFIGKAFLEAFEYAEDQNWLGLIITPTAIEKAKSYEVNPILLSHNFRSSSVIPMRKFKDQYVEAYRFPDCSEIHFQRLNEMKTRSLEKYHHKYERTIRFIEANNL